MLPLFQNKVYILVFVCLVVVLTGYYCITSKTAKTNLEEYNKTDDITTLPFCPEHDNASLSGKIPIIRTPVPTIQELETRFNNWLQPGGHWQPENCTVNEKVAIVVPFRNREEQLSLFLQHIHPFLKRQLIDYTIFVIEQTKNESFNRGMLMNIGFEEAIQMNNFDCFIFHDVDLLPEDGRNLYTCPEQPRHMSVAVDKFQYVLPYSYIFGGVTAITTGDFKLLNGFSNSYWGWGAEDDDMFNRLKYHHLNVTRYDPSIARYTMLRHKPEKRNYRRFFLLQTGKSKFDKDGISNLEYEVIKKKYNLLFTSILVDIKPPS